MIKDYLSFYFRINVNRWKGFFASKTHSSKDGLERFAVSAITSFVISVVFGRVNYTFGQDEIGKINHFRRKLDVKIGGN